MDTRRQRKRAFVGIAWMGWDGLASDGQGITGEASSSSFSVYWHFWRIYPTAHFFLVCVCARRHLGQTGKGWASEFTNRKGSCSARLTVLFLGSRLDGWGIVLDFDAAVGGVDGVVLGGRSVAVMSRNSTVLVVPTCVCVCVLCRHSSPRILCTFHFEPPNTP